MSVAALAACGGGGGAETGHPDAGGDSSKELVSFGFTAADNPGLPGDIAATIAAGSIAATVPFGTNATALVASFTTTGSQVTIASTPQVSGATANNFANPVTYRVTAADGSTQDYVVTVTVAANPAKAITGFRFLAADNSALDASVTATISGSVIAATLPTGTNITQLVATFSTTGASVTAAGVAQTSGVSVNDFTNPVVYRVTATDGSTRNYTVTVIVAPSSAKELTAFSFGTAENPSFTTGITATISGRVIVATVPSGTDVTALVATFSTTGTRVTVGATRQVSGTTVNDFRLPVVYRVTAKDNSTVDYTVTVNVAPASAKAITAFGFRSAENGDLASDVVASITGHAISAIVPAGTPLQSLVAAFSITGRSAQVGGVVQVSGTTVNDFLQPVVYRITAVDGSVQDYTVTVTIAQPQAKEITAYRFESATNPELTASVVATITGSSITAVLPSGTSLTQLVATFTSNGADVSVAGVSQASGVTPNSFANPVVYRVTARDGSTRDYTVTATVAPATAKAITSFGFLSEDNPALGVSVAAAINGQAIAATVPSGTDVTHLVAAFSTTGKSVTVVGAAQVSGVTANDFSHAVVYRVTPAQGTPQDYTVTVTVAPASAKAITAYTFRAADNSGLARDVIATISGRAITAVVPAGTAVTALVAAFSTTGRGVAVAGAAQVSGATANDFTGPVVYRVTAADGTTVDYTVTVGVAVATAKDLTAFRFESATNPGLGASVVATITGTAISATVPSGTVVTQLIATFSTTGASVTVGSAVQTSGVTPNSFASPVVYRVVAADGSFQNYTVTVTVAAAGAKAITAFSFQSADNPGLIRNNIGDISGTTIRVGVPFGTDVTHLVASFATTGTGVTIAGVAQASGQTANDFTNPVTYRVAAADGTSQNYTVTVFEASSDAAITDFRFLASLNRSSGVATDLVATITGTSISLPAADIVVDHLIATFTTTGARVTVNGVVQVSGTTQNAFFNNAAPVYRVIAGDGSTQDYTVTFRPFSSSSAR